MSELPELPCSLWSVNPVNPNKAPSSQYRQQGTGPVGLPTVSGMSHVTRQRDALLGCVRLGSEAEQHERSECCEGDGVCGVAET